MSVSNIIGSLITAVVGAVVLLFTISFIKKA
ncbi:MAG: GlsB/YeaQ/YmgE family stress response membrane protein [Gammaproteobacteria bacterium]|nr:GlsB/YeaQ/YmgE family stress response membrane protein [Gammaproteobacteria bacterium]MDX2459990.1 GlsB/YeaQ/YmgE family stress response membrane protein [Gammaproteobacteria bacterium]